MQRLGERVGAAPDADPERTRIVAVDGADDGLRAVGGFARAGGGHAVGGLAGKTRGVEIVGCRASPSRGAADWGAPAP